MSNPKVDEATTIALEAIRDAAPDLLTMTQVAEEVASHVRVSTATARNRLRAAVEEGGLLELTPWSRSFSIELPGANDARVGPFWIVREWTGTRNEHRNVISTDSSKPRPSSYGPGRTTYLADPEQIREYVQQLADEKKAKEDAEREASKAERKAQRKEITRRFPGLQRSLRTFRLLGTEMREPKGRFAAVSTKAYLEDPERHEGEKTIEERDTNVVIHAWGDENVAILRTILEAGLAAHIDSQPLTHCAHCGGRILWARQDDDGGFWWHIDSTNAPCDEGDTKAEPVEEN